MRRTIGTLFAASLLTIGLVACASSPEDPEAPVTEKDASATEQGAETDEQGTEGAGSAAPTENADELCASGEARGGDVCVVTNASVDGDLAFEGYDFVKLIDTRMTGSVAAGGLRELVVTGSSVDGDLTVTRTQGVVVKMTEVGGSLAISEAEHATLVRNEIGGDLTCDGVRADGDGNEVAGDNTCSVR
ncbi:hypothetical protein [Microbacterium halophytorum]|uniref:hypothetical protein n=1 Tax=Microbacterium halophytorum TaxID=2067568 RepID=UPI000CFCDE6C|nr:hypothetical protein [Microbacterium halophytorum]